MTPVEYRCRTRNCPNDRPLKATPTALVGIYAQPLDRRCADCTVGLALDQEWREITTRKWWRCGRCKAAIPSGSPCWTTEAAGSALRVCGYCRVRLQDLRQRYLDLAG